MWGLRRPLGLSIGRQNPRQNPDKSILVGKWQTNVKDFRVNFHFIRQNCLSHPLICLGIMDAMRGDNVSVDADTLNSVDAIPR